MLSTSLRWQLRRNEVIAGIAIKVFTLLAIYSAAFQIWSNILLSYLEENVRITAVSKVDDLESFFEISGSSARVKDPKFKTICFAGDHVYALGDAKHWFAKNEIGWISVLRAARGAADIFNGKDRSSIVLLSHTSAVILQLASEAGTSAENFGCASANASGIEIKKPLSRYRVTLFLHNGKLKKLISGQPHPVSCA